MPYGDEILKSDTLLVNSEKIWIFTSTGYLTTECGFCRPWCAKGMHVTYFFRI